MTGLPIPFCKAKKLITAYLKNKQPLYFDFALLHKLPWTEFFAIFSITQVSAQDPDMGSNGRISYGFSPQTQGKFGRTFGIRNVSGDIYVKSSVDHEKVSIYYLIVTARDQGPDSLPSDVTVIIR